MGVHQMMSVAASNHGLVRLSDAVSVGVTRRQLERMSTRGVVRSVGHNLWAIAGSRHDWQQSALRAVLATSPTALLSHRAAAGLWGMQDRRGVEVLVPMSSGCRPPGLQVHQTRFLTGVDVDQREGIPVTSVERTLVDMAWLSPLGRLARLLDRAVVLELTSHAQVARRLVTMPTRGRKGVRILRLLLEERLGSHLGDRSPFGALMARLIAGSDLPAPVRQQRVTGPDSMYYLDFAFPEHMVAVECDGLLGHGSAASQAYDLARQNDIVAAGWNLRRFTWSQVNTERWRVLRTVRSALVDNGWTPAN